MSGWDNPVVVVVVVGDAVSSVEVADGDVTVVCSISGRFSTNFR
jgi:hypothetical protein